MFKGLTPRAQRVLTHLSQEEAKRGKSDQVLPEHVIGETLRRATPERSVEDPSFLLDLGRRIECHVVSNAFRVHDTSAPRSRSS